MNENKLDHTRKYLTVNGCQITASFATERNPEVYRRVRSILMGSSAHLKKPKIYAKLMEQCSLSTEYPPCTYSDPTKYKEE